MSSTNNRLSKSSVLDVVLAHSTGDMIIVDLESKTGTCSTVIGTNHANHCPPHILGRDDGVLYVLGTEYTVSGFR